MVVNMNMRGQMPGSINDYLADTISSVFGEVYTVDVAGSTNRELFASDNPDILKNMTSCRTADESLDAMMDYVYDNLVRYEAGDRVMTDDKAPVELLGMRVIDEIIHAEVAAYKEIYRTRGLQGLLEVL